MADLPPPNSLSFDTNLFVDLGGRMDELTRQIAARILELDLLPRAEHNDARIVAESSLAGIPHLVSNDNWVNGIDQPKLNRLLALALTEVDRGLLTGSDPPWGRGFAFQGGGGCGV